MFHCGEHFFTTVYGMSEFYKWMVQPIPKDEVDIYLNMNNILLEKTELFLDIFISMHRIIKETYLGDFNYGETSITCSDEEIEGHFEWCWKKLLDNFQKENIDIQKEGEHKEYLKAFFNDSFYKQKSNVVRDSIENFFNSIFNLTTGFTKADLDIMNEIYKMMDRNVEFSHNFSEIKNQD